MGLQAINLFKISFRFLKLILSVIILFSQAIITGQNEQLCMFNGDSLKYKIIEEKEFSHKTINNDGSIIRKTSHLLHFEEMIFDELGLKVNFVWIDDSKRPNAAASNKVTDASKTDGTIYLGKSLTEVATSSRYILMHEAGHIYDFKHGFPFSGKQGEFFADYFAGFMLGYDSGERIKNDIIAIHLGLKSEKEVLEKKRKREVEELMVLHDFWGMRDVQPKNQLKATSEERGKVLNAGYILGYNEFYEIQEFMRELYAQEFDVEVIEQELKKRFFNYEIKIIGYQELDLKPSIKKIKTSFEKDIHELGLKN